VAVTKSRAK